MKKINFNQRLKSLSLKILSGHLRDTREQLEDWMLTLGPLETRHYSFPFLYDHGFAKPIRVAHLTDQHFGRITPLDLQLEAIAAANASLPDLVAITGDFVCHSELYLDDLQKTIAKIQAPVVAVLGNHDHWTNAKAVTKALKKAGAEVLCNANTIVEINNQRLQLVGLDDAYTGHDDVAKATKGLNRKLPTLGLSHIAEAAEGLWHKGVPLVLSGHTHGGQITVARIHELVVGKIGGHKYIHGLYGALKNQKLPGSVYVSAGIGSAVIPFRVGKQGRREVAIFDLGCR